MASNPMESLSTVIGYFTTVITSFTTAFLGVATSWFSWVVSEPIPIIVTGFGMVMAILAYIKRKSYL